MSNDKEGGKPPIRVVRSGDHTNLSEHQVKQFYMASQYLEWTPFAKHMKWDPKESRSSFPVREWIAEKREIIAREQAEEIAEMVFGHRSRWHNDVLKTLRDYPDTHDSVHQIIRHRINEIVETIKMDQKKAVEAAIRKETYTSSFSKVRTNELLSLTMALKTLTDSKHRSLLINDWSVKVAEQYTDPKQFETDYQQAADTSWKVEVIGGENLTPLQLQEAIVKWYDKPSYLNHTEAELAPKEPEGGE